MAKPFDTQKVSKIYRESLQDAVARYEEMVRGLSILRRLNESLQLGADFNEICQELVKLISEEIDIENCSLMIVDKDGEYLVRVAGWSLVDEENNHICDRIEGGQVKFKIGEGIAGCVAREGQPVFIEDTSGEKQFIVHPQAKMHIGSVVCLPLFHRNNVIGVLNLSNSEPYSIEESKEHEFRAIADYVSVALVSAQLYDNLQQLNTNLEHEVRIRTRELEQANLELREKQHLLEASEAKYRDLVENSTDMIFRLDEKGIFLDSNRQGLEALGWTLKELRQKSLHDMVLPEDKGTLTMTFMKLMDKGDVRDIEFRVHTKSEEKCYLQMSAALQKDEKTNRVIVRTFVRDITRKRELEQQVFQSHKMESLGTLASGVAHDFNNLLAGILGYAALIKNRLKGDDTRLSRYAETIESSAQRAAELTQQLLSFARKTATKAHAINPNDLIEETIRIAGRTIEKTINITTNLATDIWPVRVEPSQLQQTLLNLFINARDAMPDGGTLTISSKNMYVDEDFASTRPNIEPGNYVTIRVADTGQGMPERTKLRIFEPFFSTKEKDKGTGLGLTIVYGVVKSHGGFITVDSEIGKGSTFSLYFPSTIETASDATLSQEVLSEPSGGTETIMIVDDEETVREVAKDILEEKGYRLILAADGEEGLEKFKQYKNIINLVFLDIMMPKITGKELVGKLKAIKPDVKIILTSGMDSEGINGDHIRDNIEAFVQKPFLPSDILTLVRRVLDRH